MMQDIHSVLASETPACLNRKVTSIHFLERARHYRYAAALTDDPHNIQRFIDLAFIFERLAHDFARLEAQKVPPIIAKGEESRSQMHESRTAGFRS